MNIRSLQAASSMSPEECLWGISTPTQIQIDEKKTGLLILLSVHAIERLGSAKNL